MRLWSGVLSPFSAKVRIALAEKQVPCEILTVPWSRERLWDPKPPEFLAVSPLGQVPVLLADGGPDGETPVVDSTVIIEYLDERFPEPALLPREPLARALCRFTEARADTAMQDLVTPLIREVFNKPDASTRDEAAIAEATKGLGEYYAVLDAQLEGRDYLCGAFSVADPAAFMVLGFGATLGAAPDPALVRLAAWQERVQARPSVGEEFRAMMVEAARV